MMKRKYSVRLRTMALPAAKWALSIVEGLARIYLNNPIRRYWIHRTDVIDLRKTDLRTARSVIIFLVPGFDIVNGGVRSIVSLAAESEKLVAIHNSVVFVCSMPDDPPLKRFTKFKNSTPVFSLWSVTREATQVEELLVHVPEAYVGRIREHIYILDSARKRCRVRFNILLQNIDFLPDPRDLDYLKTIGPITCSTAHRRYLSESVASAIGCPMFHFSTLADPSQYTRKAFGEKKNLIVMSPDFSPDRASVIEALSATLPEFEFRVVKNITFETYCEWIADAKFAITFGEGLDGYFVESIFSGAIGCAVYNDRFFTEDFLDMPFVFPSWPDMVAQLPRMIGQAQSANVFEVIQSEQYDFLCRVYRFSEYIDNLRTFYEEVNVGRG